MSADVVTVEPTRVEVRRAGLAATLNRLDSGRWTVTGPGLPRHSGNLEFDDAVQIARESVDGAARVLHLRAVLDEVRLAREAAHQTHGDESIEATDPADTGRWLANLGEEFGEVCHALTYELAADLRAELVDVLVVATAWVQALDEAGR